MKKQVIQKEIFVTEDERLFDNETDALNHEKKINLLKDISKSIPQGKQFYAVYITNTSLQVNLEDVFNVSKPTVGKLPGWNLIEDMGHSSNIFAIEDLLENYSTPTNRSINLSEGEQKNIAQFKKAIADIVIRSTKLQATPEAILGNLIMELQDLIR